MGAAWPFVAASHPIHKHLTNADTLARADASLAAADWKPQFLSSQQSETLLALSEAIVPGSAKGNVHRFIDLLLTVDTPENQRSFVHSLNAMDQEAASRWGKAFPLLGAEHQKLLLTDASTKDSLRQEGKEDSSGKQQPLNLRDHFENLKGWISGAYYSSEAGMTELGWTGDRAFETFPGCTHPDNHS